MLPGGYKSRRRCVSVTPIGPLAVHLVPEADYDRVTVGADCLGIRAQVAVVVSGRDAGNVDAVRIHLDERYRAVISHGLGETCWKRDIPPAVVHDYIRLSPCGVGKRCYRSVRVGESLGIHT